MKLLRTLSTRRLLLLVAGLVALVGVTTAAVGAVRSSGPTPPPRPLAAALHEALAAPAPAGVTARIRFTNGLFPTGAIAGEVGSALISGASGRLWATNDGRGRLELQSNAGDVQIVWNQRTVTAYDASSNTVYRLELPARAGEPRTSTEHAPPTLAEISRFLNALGEHAVVSGAEPTNVAGEEAYSVRLGPKESGGLLGSARLAWDAVNGLPLRVGVYARGATKPVLELAATDISFGSVSASDVDIAPPPGAKHVDLNLPAHGAKHEGKAQPNVTGLSAVEAAAGFPVSAPASLAGLQRTHVRLVGDTALVVYGEGPGAIAVVERAADGQAQAGALSNLPTVRLGGVSAHELTTPLGTLLQWRDGGVAYLLGGSVPAATAETAARGLQ